MGPFASDRTKCKQTGTHEPVTSKENIVAACKLVEDNQNKQLNSVVVVVVVGYALHDYVEHI